MSTQTSNLKLVKPSDGDSADIAVINSNMDIIDTALGAYGSQFSNAAITHRNVFRGKNLGTSVTTAQWNAITNQTFDDLYVGDYWTLTTTVSGTTYTRNWRIADINYYMNCGDTNFTTPHLIVVPDTNLYNAQMNATNITTDGYVGSAMRKTNINTAVTIANNVFGSTHTKTHRIYLEKTMTNGYPSAGDWTDSLKVELMSENQVYGHPQFRPGTFYYTGTNTTVPNNYNVDYLQLALFQLAPTFVHTRETYWLRDVASSALFCLVYGNGLAGTDNASNSHGVRPLVVIG